ncbi:MAG: cytochrome c3 family protein [Dehalococcoidia bacterium]|nr:cytochrome c3 family protein [Dehalococcoidia bacterium]
MNRPSLLAVRTLVVLAALTVTIVAVTIVSASVGRARSPSPPVPAMGNEECVACHSIKGLKLQLPSGETLQLYVDQSTMTSSVHGKGGLLCVDCHQNISAYPHPPKQFDDLRGLTMSMYEVCKRCHFVEYTKSLDSIHFADLATKDEKAPVCTDCHGSHDITAPNQPRSRVSTTCSRCHQGIFDTYSKSVHGAALMQDNNPDVPVCTDCHGVHSIQNPTTSEFKVQSLQLCANCHTDKAKMKKYGISTAVISTYLTSFHGMAVSLSADKKTVISEPACTDCHGVHDIQKAGAATSPVIKLNLLTTCQKCHAGASPNFPDSWVGHYEPSLHNSPAVFLIGWFYKLMIPFIVGGLMVHILLDLWKIVTNR